MNTEISDLIRSGKKIALARLEIDGEPKRLGHGELTFDDQTIVPETENEMRPVPPIPHWPR
jgi:hypothetical protein